MRLFWAVFVWCCIAAPADAANVRVILRDNPDGVKSELFPCVLADRSDCAPPTTATLTCNDSAAESLIGLVTGNAYSANVRQYFGGTAAATAALSVVTVSGDDATSEGWAIASAGAGNNLTHSGSGTGAGAFKIRGTTAGNSVDCSVRAWTYIAAPAADSTAPTIPTGLTTTSVSGGVKLDFDHPSDPFAGGEAGSGIDEIDIRLGSTVVHTLTAGVTPSTMPLLTALTIGTVTNTSANQSGTNWTLQTRGAGFTGTSDNGYFLAAQFSGDFTITYKVASFDSVLPFGHCGGMVRESTDANSPFGFLLQSTDETAIGIRAQSRTTVGGTKTTLATAAPNSAPQWQQLSRVGNTISYAYSSNGNTFTALASGTVAMGSTVYAGIAVASQDTGTTVTCEIEQLSITSAPRLTYTHTTATGGNYSVRSRDADSNNSSYGAGVSGTPSGGGAPQVKWHPGHYMLSNSNMSPGVAGYTASHITAIAGDANIEGVIQRAYWATFESSRGVYDFSPIDTLLALAQASGKRLIVQLQDRTFGGTSANGVLPSYLASETGGGGGWCVKPNNAGVVAKQWLGPIMDRFIALAQAMSAHVVPNSGGLTLDEHPYFEGIVSVESSPGGVALGSCGLDNRAQLAAQLKRWIEGVKPAWPRTNVFSNMNFLSGEIEGMIANLIANDGGISGPDTVPSPADPDPGFGTAAQRVWKGYREALTSGGALTTSGATDYRGVAPALWQVQSPELGCRKEGDHTLSAIAVYGAAIGGTHMGWLRHTPGTTYCTENGRPYHTWTDRCTRTAGTLSCNDTQGISDYLNGTPQALDTSCPTIYGGGCDTD